MWARILNQVPLWDVAVVLQGPGLYSGSLQMVSWWWEKRSLSFQTVCICYVAHSPETPVCVLCARETEKILFNVWFLDINCISKQICFWSNVIVLFPLKENAFSYHCEVNKNNFGLEKLVRERALTFRVLYWESPRSEASLLGVGKGSYLHELSILIMQPKGLTPIQSIVACNNGVSQKQTKSIAKGDLEMLKCAAVHSRVSSPCGCRPLAALPSLHQPGCWGFPVL